MLCDQYRGYDMKPILCRDCKKKIGTIEENAMVCSGDQYMGIDIYCKDCKSKHIGKYYRDENQLIDWEGYNDT